jgi:hypothetical protein
LGTTNTTGVQAEGVEIKDRTLEVLEYFVDYVELLKTDPRSGIVDYRHYEDQQAKQLSLDNAVLVLEYEVVRIEKISDQLWLVEFFLKTEKGTLGYYVINYVGEIDGRLWIMTNEKQIPEKMKEGVVLEEYKPHGPGVVDEEDVLGRQ